MGVINRCDIMSHQLFVNNLRRTEMNEQEKRILQLENAVDIALEYLEEIMGSDFDESETVAYIKKLLNNEE